VFVLFSDVKIEELTSIGKHIDKLSELLVMVVEDGASRKKAYVDALKMINEPIKEEWMFHDCLTIEDGERLAQELFHMKQWPEALLVASDQVAAGVILACQKYGWDIPGDLAVVGFDNHPIAHALGMTTIEHPSAEMGTEAFRLLHRQIHQKAGKEDRELTFRLLKRKSA
jgi:DNA-binding LacI/PurR family transcriptional regulator